jgi:hypothetical protein
LPAVVGFISGPDGYALFYVFGGYALFYVFGGELGGGVDV